MKAVTVLFLVVYTALAQVNRCPEDQKTDWTIEYLYEHDIYCNLFYHCTHGYPILKWCPNELPFDYSSQRCDWTGTIDCNGKPILPPPPSNTTTSTTTPSTTTTTTPSTTTSTTTTTTTTTTPSTTTSSSTTSTTEEPPIFGPNGCPVNPHIHWLLPHATDCNRFYYCVWGQLAERRCPAVLHFNRILQVCDWPVRAGCPL